MKIKLTLLLMLWTGSIPALVSQTILIPPDLANGDNFGRNVSIHEHRIVASTNNFNELNTVHAFQKTGAQWEYDGELMPGDLTLSDEYGRDLDVYGDYAVVGAPSAGGQGKAYVFHRTGDQQWTMMQALQSADIAAGDMRSLAKVDLLDAQGGLLDRITVGYTADAQLMARSGRVAWTYASINAPAILAVPSFADLPALEDRPQVPEQDPNSPIKPK